MAINLESISLETGTERMVMGPYVPPAEILLQRHVGLAGLESVRWEKTSPLAVGSTDTGVKVGARTATIQVALAADTNPELERIRRKLNAILAPTSDLFTVIVTGLDEIDRISYASCVRPPELDSQLRLQSIYETRFQLRFPDPLWRGRDVHTVEVRGVPAPPGGFNIPLPIPFDISGLSWGGNQTVIYTGTWPACPRVRVTGPITSFSIVNATTGGFVRFHGGYSLPAGVTWTFDPEGVRTFELEAQDGTKQNAVHTIDTSSNLTDWCLARGSNAITILGSGQADTTGVTMIWEDTFVGI